MSDHGLVRFRWFIPLAALLAITALAACGGTWVDDDKNFERIFDFPKPSDVRVVHSFYWKSPHWTTEYRYYIQLQPSAEFAKKLTDPSLMTPVNTPTVVSGTCVDQKTAWFLPRDIQGYDAWLPNTKSGYRVFRDKTDGTLFVCDERL